MPNQQEIDKSQDASLAKSYENAPPPSHIPPPPEEGEGASDAECQTDDDLDEDFDDDFDDDLDDDDGKSKNI